MDAFQKARIQTLATAHGLDELLAANTPREVFEALYSVVRDINHKSGYEWRMQWQNTSNSDLEQVSYNEQRFAARGLPTSKEMFAHKISTRLYDRIFYAENCLKYYRQKAAAAADIASAMIEQLAVDDQSSDDLQAVGRLVGLIQAGNATGDLETTTRDLIKQVQDFAGRLIEAHQETLRHS